MAPLFSKGGRRSLVSASIKRHADPNSAHKLIVGVADAVADADADVGFGTAEAEDDETEDEDVENDDMEEGERGPEAAE
jgi:hypothetical protein